MQEAEPNQLSKDGQPASFGGRCHHPSQNRSRSLGKLSEATRFWNVDDERTTSETLTVIFTRHGYEARYALSAEAAIQLTAEWVPEFSLIDVMLPGMDGLALAIVISAKYPSSRVLLFTGDMASAELLVSARKSDREFQILPKPIHPTVLLETAKRLLA
jgi:DNA-binding NtrC family response regulator